MVSGEYNVSVQQHSRSEYNSTYSRYYAECNSSNTNTHEGVGITITDVKNASVCLRNITPSVGSTSSGYEVAGAYGYNAITFFFLFLLSGIQR